MNVQIEKSKSRFSVRCKYNEDILALIQKYEKRFWNREKLEWSLPIDALQDFTKDIQKLVGIKIEIKENKPYEILGRNNDKIELKFAQFINQFDPFKSIDQVEYDKENRKLVIPETKITDVIKLLKDNNIDFIYDINFIDHVKKPLTIKNILTEKNN